MCRCLSIHPSGLYAWVKNPLSPRAHEDARHTKLLKDVWKDSGKVYGYPKLHDDLVEQGKTSCPNRIARLARLAGIRAQIGYKRKPGKYGGKPSVLVDNTLDRQFDVAEPDTAWGRSLLRHWFKPNGRRYYLHQDLRGVSLSGRRHRPLLASCDRLGHAIKATNRPFPTSAADGCLAAQANANRANSHRSRLAVHQPRLGRISAGPQH